MHFSVNVCVFAGVCPFEYLRPGSKSLEVSCHRRRCKRCPCGHLFGALSCHRIYPFARCLLSPPQPSSPLPPLSSNNSLGGGRPSVDCDLLADHQRLSIPQPLQWPALSRRRCGDAPFATSLRSMLVFFSSSRRSIRAASTLP